MHNSILNVLESKFWTLYFIATTLVINLGSIVKDQVVLHVIYSFKIHDIKVRNISLTYEYPEVSLLSWLH